MRRMVWGFAGCTYHIVGNWLVTNIIGVNPLHAEPRFILFWKYCRSRSAGFWQSHLIRIHTVFQPDRKYMITTGMLQVNKVKTGQECSTQKYSARQGFNQVYHWLMTEPIAGCWLNSWLSWRHLLAKIYFMANYLINIWLFWL